MLLSFISPVPPVIPLLHKPYLPRPNRLARIHIYLGALASTVLGSISFITNQLDHRNLNMAPEDDDSSDLSSLSSLSPAPSDEELDAPSPLESDAKNGILSYFSKVSDLPPKEPSPPPRKRSPSPPHEYVLADNPDIAVRKRI